MTALSLVPADAAGHPARGFPSPSEGVGGSGQDTAEVDRYDQLLAERFGL